MPTRRRALLIAGIAAVLLGGAALAIFQPWLLVVDVTVEEELPDAAPPPTPDPSVTVAPLPAVPVEVARGEFISHEHATTGTATIVENPDGSRVLALAGLDTSNGPDLHVWLSAADVVEGPDGWFTAGSAASIDLGPLKGNLGDQVYDIPTDADLSGIRSVTIWCVRFSVSFGAAQLGASAR